jgi:hypothetical protein
VPAAPEEARHAPQDPAQDPDRRFERLHDGTAGGPEIRTPRAGFPRLRSRGRPGGSSGALRRGRSPLADRRRRRRSPRTSNPPEQGQDRPHHGGPHLQRRPAEDSRRGGRRRSRPRWRPGVRACILRTTRRGSRSSFLFSRERPSKPGRAGSRVPRSTTLEGGARGRSRGVQGRGAAGRWLRRDRSRPQERGPPASPRGRP